MKTKEKKDTKKYEDMKFKVKINVLLIYWQFKYAVSISDHSV
jgi:hypothetical protein